MHIYAHHFAVFLRVGDHIVDGDLGGCTGSGGNGDDRHGLLGGGRYALQGDYIAEFRVLNDNTDGFGGVHRGAAANGDDAVCAAGLKGGHAGLHILHRGVGLDFAVDFIVNAGILQHIGHFLRYIKFNQVRVRAHKALFEPAAFHFTGDLLDRTGAVVTGLIQYKSVCHNKLPLLIEISAIFFRRLQVQYSELIIYCQSDSGGIHK